MIMKSLIEKRKKEDFKRFNKDKINSSPFTDKIDAIYATVEKQLRKLRELEEQQNERKLSQQRQQEQANEYEQAYENYYSLPSQHMDYIGTNKLSFSPVKLTNEFTPITEHEKRIHKALTKPLNTAIMVDDLTTEERNEMGLLLKEFYEKHIKTLALNKKLLVGYFVNGSWLYRPLDNEAVKNTLEKMLNGNYVFSCDTLQSIGSDVEVNVSLSFIDAIIFKSVENEKAEGERNRQNPSKFYPKRLKQEWRWFKVFLRELAIGCDLYS